MEIETRVFERDTKEVGDKPAKSGKKGGWIMGAQSVQSSLRIHGTLRMGIALIGLAVWLNGGQVLAAPILFPGGGASQVIDNGPGDLDLAVGIIRVAGILIPGTASLFSGEAKIIQGVNFLKFTITGQAGGPPGTITSGGVAEPLQGGMGIEFIRDNYAFTGKGSLRTNFDGTLEKIVPPGGMLAGGSSFGTDANANTFAATDGGPGNDALAFWNGPAGAHPGPDQVFNNPPPDFPVRTGTYAAGGGIAKGFVRFKMGANEQFKFPDSAEFEFEAVPEPSTLTLLGIGTLGLLAHSWRRLRSRRRS